MAIPFICKLYKGVNPLNWIQPSSLTELLPSKVLKIPQSTATSLTKPADKDGMMTIDFFLENGNINVKLTSGEEDSATGTPSNDAYQAIRTQLNGLNSQMMAIYNSMSDTTLTDEQREAKGKEMEALENKMMEVTKAGIQTEHHQSGRCTFAETELLLYGCSRS